MAKLAFLVFGPMFDLKLLFIYSAVFRKRFVAGLACRSFYLDRPDLRAIENTWTMTASVQRYISAGVLAIWGSHAGAVLFLRASGVLPASFTFMFGPGSVASSWCCLAAGLLFLPEHEDLSVSHVAIICTVSRRR